MPIKKLFVFCFILILLLFLSLELICSLYLINRYRGANLINHPNENNGYSLSIVKIYDGILRKYFNKTEEEYYKHRYDYRKIIYKKDWVNYFEKAYVNDIKSIRNDLKVFEKEYSSFTKAYYLSFFLCL